MSLMVQKVTVTPAQKSAAKALISVRAKSGKAVPSAVVVIANAKPADETRPAGSPGPISPS
jgi:hypothetical protein